MDEIPRLSAAFISVGSNIDPLQNVTAALIALLKKEHVVSSSTFYRTRPIGGESQPKFVNGVWQIRTALAPRQIKDYLLQPIEQSLGRQRTADKFTPRTIDLDLVLYNDLVVNEAGLMLPHPDLVRPFVHAPVRELLDRDGSGIDTSLKDRIARLLPAQSPRPGEVLVEFTKQLTRLVREAARQRTLEGSPTTPSKSEPGSPGRISRHCGRA
jgi:2-amino-4-hydroxy-6-hydroxymethyldihydropteridine diphosphokinase